MKNEQSDAKSASYGKEGCEQGNYPSLLTHEGFGPYSECPSATEHVEGQKK